MKVSVLIEKLQELNPEWEIGLAEGDGVVEVRAIESDVANDVYRLV